MAHPDAVTVVLGLDEAVPLAAAWVQRRAEERSIRTIIIKGAALERHGLRAPHTSMDVDVLVEPHRFDDLCTSIVDSGWRVRPSNFISELRPRRPRHPRWRGRPWGDP